MSNLIKKKFKIEGMHCTSCALNIDMDLEDINGVKSANTSYAKSMTEVEFEQDKINEKLILETVKNTGYSASPLEK